jgi:hypothetical protein
MARKVQVALLVVTGLCAIPWLGTLFELIGWGALIGAIPVGFLFVSAWCIWMDFGFARLMAAVSPVITALIFGFIGADNLHNANFSRRDFIEMFGLPFLLSVVALALGVFRAAPQD